MAVEVWPLLVAQLKEHGIEFDVGLTDAETAATEARFGFRFPPDLRAFLQTALPSGERFPNWRSGKEADLRSWLDLPRQGILFDIEHNGFCAKKRGPQLIYLDTFQVTPPCQPPQHISAFLAMISATPTVGFWATPFRGKES